MGEASWDLHHYRFTGMHAPRSSACLSQEIECAEVVEFFLSSEMLVSTKMLVEPAADECHRLGHGLRNLGVREVALDDPTVLHATELLKLWVGGARLTDEHLVGAYAQR